MSPTAPPGGPRRVVLGVAGGIAAYKAALLLRELTESGHEVTVVPTAAAERFVGRATFEALSGRRVAHDVWTGAEEVPHVRLGRHADLVVVAPATADLLARAAHGLADDLLTNVLLTATCPVLLAPAMHTEMWLNPAVQANVALLRSRGVTVLEPASGRLTGADSGPGRLPEPAEIAAACRRLLGSGARGHDLAGRRVVVSAGGTREPLDPVRYLGNRSSGRQGVALAAAAAARGAHVTLVAAHLQVPAPAAVEVVPVGTALELRDAVVAAAADADAVVMAAAVADFRPATRADSKIKKSDDPARDPVVVLERNPDVLAGLVTARAAAQGAGGGAGGGGARRPVIAGFAAETGDETGSVLEHGRAKLARKGCDLLVLNEVGEGRGFGTATNAVVLLGADGTERTVPEASKDVVADAVWDALVPMLTAITPAADDAAENAAENPETGAP
ncbi:bifunctional phosphopantothenoylcysteine decarboxylase/phosphopantothenate--cysteine ligase CoaBC [Paenibacillus sp. TRM 82003]|uniref:bifunctional phosphopantothenoylcysteine decarboxylase/phosphopantothenate--cysteine ligase CoaBC n=1 Tax=Kineococcus sp. TRM81007 TaxID=2925831 RepID=UPI001F5B00A7|nr:bifunctional phosphopantothenoylcysteine decarboxylase/phosphopantothenate--cysteine ligase CoaBC [Kineococcus sp. TRM81007]MCI2239054.1 bifunctional phosphopantothenoylcysteine decarboxylase/phosphopantothenate--cysteine ligase CoaBC [Kineococcus sp. TRM81007]MCI3924474.1 bifunctional phosphopantothenoylcysteine decarboxylase/phosphopantothenate--cysteine ligase CoaBC [Paenibacillus sp. TRM 82003]